MISKETTDFLSFFPGTHLFAVFDPPSHTTDLNWICGLANTERSVYFTVNETDNSGHRTKANIVNCRTLFLDDDNPRDTHRTDWPLPPSIITETSQGKYHYYWLIEGGTTNFKEWELVEEALVSQFQGDEAVKDISRVLRIPGTINHKNGFKCKVISSSSTYPWRDLVSAFPKAVETPSSSTESAPSSTSKFNEAQSYQDFITGKHITNPMNSMIMSWSYRYSEKNIKKKLKHLFQLPLPKEHAKRYQAAHEQIDKFIKTAKKTANVDVPTYEEWERVPPIGDVSELYREIEFPLEYMPESMLRAAKEIAKYNLMTVHDVAPALVVAACMSINKKAQIQAGSESLEVYFHLSAFFIAESGKFKSTVYNLVLGGVHEGDKVQIEAAKQAESTAQAAVSVLKKAITKAENSAIKSSDGTIPSLADIMASLSGPAELIEQLDIVENRRQPGMFIDDVTQEAAIEKAFNAGGAINFVAEEGQGIISSWSDKYNKGSASTDFALRGMSGSMYRHDRKGSNVAMSFRPVISCMIFVQPDIYESQFLSNQNINSSGMAARILPIPWRDTSYKNGKNLGNVEINENELKEYWHVTKQLAMFDDTSVSFSYDTDDNYSPQLIKPVTKICINKDMQQDYINLFNEYWFKYAKGSENEGKLGVLNKCGTMAYIMAGSLFAYENYETFYNNEKHTMSRKMFNAVKALTKYLIDKKKQEEVVKEYAQKIAGAKKVLKTITSNSNIALSLEGITVSVFHRMTNYNRSSTDTDLIDSGQLFLMELGYVKIIDDKIYLNPKYSSV